MLTFERQIWSAFPGAALAGVDEAGRGCLAGPVVAGAVAMPQALAEALYAGGLAGLTDSKQLTAAARDAFFEILTRTPGVACATGWCSAGEIDRLNILAATHLAMRRALEGLPRPAARAQPANSITAPVVALTTSPAL
jgi:ribonuclease HII